MDEVSEPENSIATVVDKTNVDEEKVNVAPGAGSVETNCPICLDEMDNKSFLDSCFHILHSQVQYVSCTCIDLQPK